MSAVASLHGNWTILAKAAVHLRDSRDRHDAASVEARCLTPEKAASRRRVAHALAALYRAIADTCDIPALPACAAEIRHDLAAASAVAAKGARTLADQHYAACLAAMLHNHRPCVADHASSTPMVIACHQINQARRAQQKEATQ